MTHPKKSRTHLLVAALVLGFMVPAIAWTSQSQPATQSSQQGEKARRGGEWGRMGPRGQRGQRGQGRMQGPMRMFRELDLTETQRETIRAIFRDSTARDGMEALATLRRSVEDAIDRGAFEGEIRELTDQLGRVEGDLAVARSNLQRRIREEVLTQEQVQKLDELKAEHKARMEERRQRFQERRQQRQKQNQNPGIEF